MSENEERRPVEGLADLGTLDPDEVREGYRDAHEGLQCGDNRSRSYWHGWRNGMADQGKMPVDNHMRSLAREFASPPRSNQRGL